MLHRHDSGQPHLRGNAAAIRGPHQAAHVPHSGAETQTSVSDRSARTTNVWDRASGNQPNCEHHTAVVSSR